MARRSVQGARGALESVKDISPSNVWGTDGSQIAALWLKEKDSESFNVQEEKILNILRLAFEVVHYDPADERDNAKYGNEDEWAQLDSVVDSSHKIAIRPKVIGKITDLTMQNIQSISAASLLDLINRNFGNGWEALPPTIREVIESAFDISTMQLPTSRLHMPGGTLERKLEAGFEVLEIARGTWTEAIFARKRELPDPALYADDPLPDDNDLIIDGDDVDEDAEDETFYSNFAEEPAELDEDTEGLTISKEEDLDD